MGATEEGEWHRAGTYRLRGEVLSGQLQEELLGVPVEQRREIWEQHRGDQQPHLDDERAG